MIAVGTYIRVLRDATGLSQEEAAVRANISAKTLGRWERGIDGHEPGISNLRRLVETLGGSFKDALQLLTRDETTEMDGRHAAEVWLAFTPEERERIDSVLASTSSDELSEIIEELRAEYRNDPGLIALLRGVLLGWRARGSGSPRQ